MTFRPDTSFPYLAIAKRFDVPYGQVLATLERFEHPLSVPASDEWLDWKPMQKHIADAIYDAWRAEKTRRFMVNEGPL